MNNNSYFTLDAIRKVILSAGFFCFFQSVGFCVVYEKSSNEIFVSSESFGSYAIDVYNSVNGSYENGIIYYGLWLYPSEFNFLQETDNFLDFPQDLVDNFSEQFLIGKKPLDYQYSDLSRDSTFYYEQIGRYPSVKYFLDVGNLNSSGYMKNGVMENQVIYKVDEDFQTFLFSLLFFFALIVGVKIGRG